MLVKILISICLVSGAATGRWGVFFAGNVNTRFFSGPQVGQDALSLCLFKNHAEKRGQSWTRGRDA